MGFLDFVADVTESVATVANRCVELVAEHPGEALLVVGATTVTGGLCWVAAPAIAATAGSIGLLGAASTGTAISSLSGAALTNASLAAIGGGALAAGGGGMTAGVATIATAGAALGGAATTGVTVVASKRGEDNEAE